VKVVEDWYVELRGPLAHYLGTLGCAPSLAEELTQEAFFRLLRAREEQLEVRDPRAWLFRVARNLWIDHRREALRFSSIGDLPFPDGTPNPEQQLLHSQRLRRMADHFAKLPKVERECLELKTYGLSYRQIATIQGISVNHAMDCVRRGMARLRRRSRGL
jgi:RNA polymerase sigma-70 factor (ECF subfamily)